MLGLEYVVVCEPVGRGTLRAERFEVEGAMLGSLALPVAEGEPPRCEDWDTEADLTEAAR
jgi:hypothetical protein